MPSYAAMADLKHGRTLDEVERIARWAVLHHRSLACDARDRLSAARLAVIDLIYADEPPADRDLFNAAAGAIRDLVQDDLRHRGTSSRDHWAGDGSARNFQRYWLRASVAPSPEDRVVDHVAVGQILSTLRPQHQRVLLAVAGDIDDRDAAAERLGYTRRTLDTYLDQARQHFLALWHEHEKPSRKWRADSKPRPHRQTRPCGTPSAYARHRAHREEACQPCKTAWTTYLKDRAAAKVGIDTHA